MTAWYDAKDGRSQMTEELEAKLDAGYVDYMRAWSKRYLGRVRATIHTIEMIRSEIAEMERSLDGVGAVRYDREAVRSAPDDEGLLRRIERMESLRAEFADELDANLQAQADAHRALANVRQPWRALLTYRYLQGKTWADVADALNALPGVHYSEDYIRKEMHDNALVELFPFVPHEYDEFPEAI